MESIRRRLHVAPFPCSMRLALRVTDNKICLLDQKVQVPTRIPLRANKPHPCQKSVSRLKPLKSWDVQSGDVQNIPQTFGPGYGGISDEALRKCTCDLTAAWLLLVTHRCRLTSFLKGINDLRQIFCLQQAHGPGGISIRALAFGWFQLYYGVECLQFWYFGGERLYFTGVSLHYQFGFDAAFLTLVISTLPLTFFMTV